MEFYDAVERRKTTREFLKKDVDFAAVRRILEAGNRAPTWDHNRNWRYILLRTDEEKECAFAEAKKIADKFDAERYLQMPRPYPITLGLKMYGYAVPKQFTMLQGAPYVLIPLGLSCSMRIPLDAEHDAVKARLKIPSSYRIPAFIGIGYADPEEAKPELPVLPRSGLDQMGEEQRDIFFLLSEKARGPDEIVGETEIPARRVNTALTILQAQGYLQELPGRRFTAAVRFDQDR